MAPGPFCSFPLWFFSISIQLGFFSLLASQILCSCEGNRVVVVKNRKSAWHLFLFEPFPFFFLDFLEIFLLVFLLFVPLSRLLCLDIGLKKKQVFWKQYSQYHSPSSSSHVSLYCDCIVLVIRSFFNTTELDHSALSSLRLYQII